MDRFKFRVWNIENKNFIYDAIYAYDGNNYKGKDNDGWIYCFGEYIDKNNEYIVEQCTGLKDKNGKLIYEGDIVNTSNFGKCFIEWADDEAGFTLHSIETVNYYSIYCCKDFEIIGNIHENKDLLGDM